MILFKHHTQFITITNYNWIPLLQNDKYKQVIIEALKQRVVKQQVTIYGYVIMPNHLHILWQIQDKIDSAIFQRDFLKFTARSILWLLKSTNNPILSKLIVDKKDRKYQIWKRDSLSINIYSEKVFLQKLNYIHNNPLKGKWKSVNNSYEYQFSSAKYYDYGIDEFEILSHYKGLINVGQATNNGVSQATNSGK